MHHTAHRARPSTLPRLIALGLLAFAINSCLASRATARASRRAFVEADGLSLHYAQKGEGPPLVLLHGAGSLIDDFELSGLIDLAAEKHRVIAFDRPGYGLTERPSDRTWTPEAQADLIHDALENLDIGPATIVGHSWGALVALALAMRHPGAVSNLVLVSGKYYPARPVAVALASAAATPVLGALLRNTLQPFIGRLFWRAIVSKLFAPGSVPATFAGFPRELALRPSQLRASAEDAANLFPALKRFAPRYAAITVPTAILAGAGDEIVNAGQSEKLHSEIPGSELHVISGSGHMLHHSAAAQIISAIETLDARMASSS